MALATCTRCQRVESFDERKGLLRFDRPDGWVVATVSGAPIVSAVLCPPCADAVLTTIRRPPPPPPLDEVDTVP